MGGNFNSGAESFAAKEGPGTAAPSVLGPSPHSLSRSDICVGDVVSDRNDPRVERISFRRSTEYVCPARRYVVDPIEAHLVRQGSTDGAVNTRQGDDRVADTAAIDRPDLPTNR